MQIARGACNRRLCPLRTKSANASACIFLCLRSAPKRWFGTQSVRLFSQKTAIIHTLGTRKKHISAWIASRQSAELWQEFLSVYETDSKDFLRGRATKILLKGKGLSCKRKSVPNSTDFRGGEGWIRTTEVTDNRFTVCSLWPLGNLSIGAGDRNRTNNLLITNQLLCLLSYTSVFSCWCLGADSNHRHRDFQSLALPPELPRHI